MADKQRDIPQNPLLARLVPEGATSAISFRGWVGPSTKDGYLQLYLSLEDLSQSVEISRSDVIDFAELPDSILPLGAVIVWVKRDATITQRNVQALRNGDAADVQPLVRDVGRLRLRLRRPQAGETCQSRCSTCQSRCSTCQSRCSARRF